MVRSLTKPYKEEICHKAFSKHGLRLDVPISYLDVGLSSPLPVLKPSDFLKLVDETRSWDKLCGQADLTVAESMFELFWSRYEQLYPNFGIFNLARRKQVDLHRCCPIYIHGDEGTHYKKSAIMVLQWQGVLGKGTAKNQVVQHGVNSLGHTLRTRLLIGVMTKDQRVC